jgi:hypothetical protein
VASNKVYDTTVTASLAGGATVTPLGRRGERDRERDRRVLDKNVGIGVRPGQRLSLAGTDAGNYCR